MPVAEKVQTRGDTVGQQRKKNMYYSQHLNKLTHHTNTTPRGFKRNLLFTLRQTQLGNCKGDRTYS